MILKISFIMVLFASAIIFNQQAKLLYERRVEIEQLKDRAKNAEESFVNCINVLSRKHAKTREKKT